MRLFRLASIVCFIMLVPIGGAVVYGHFQSQPTKAQTFGIDSCTDRLCFFGIAPGVTRWSKALTLLEQHGAVQKTLDEDIYAIDQTRLRVEYNPQTQLVTYIAIIDQSGVPLPVTVGDTIRYLGPPCAVDPNTFQLQTLILIYPHARITVALDSSHLSPSTLIRDMILPAAEESCKTEGVAWPGFTTPDRYRQLYFQ